MNELGVRNLSVRYEGQETYAIEGVTFDLPTNTITVVIGPNGSGKSTLFKAILGLIPYQGKISYSDGKNSDPHFHAGYLPQRFVVDQSIPLRVDEFLNLTLVTCKHLKAEKLNMITEALTQVGAENFHNKLLRDLSGGQLQRVLLARALVHSPELLVLDEPEAGVDPGGEKIFYDLVKKLVAKKKITALIASHEMTLVRSYADQVICLNQKVICAGPPEKALKQVSLNKLYQEDLWPHSLHTK